MADEGLPEENVILILSENSYIDIEVKTKLLAYECKPGNAGNQKCSMCTWGELGISCAITKVHMRMYMRSKPPSGRDGEVVSTGPHLRAG